MYPLRVFINSGNNGLKVSKKATFLFSSTLHFKRQTVSLKSSLPITERFKHVSDTAVSYTMQEHCFSHFPWHSLTFFYTFIVFDNFSFWYNFKCRHRKAVETVQGTLLYPLSRFNHCWYFALSVYFYMHIPPPPPPTTYLETFSQKCWGVICDKKDILLCNHSTPIKVRKFIIATKLLFNPQSLFHFCHLSQ